MLSFLLPLKKAISLSQHTSRLTGMESHTPEGESALWPPPPHAYCSRLLRQRSLEPALSKTSVSLCWVSPRGPQVGCLEPQGQNGRWSQCSQGTAPRPELRPADRAWGVGGAASHHCGWLYWRPTRTCPAPVSLPPTALLAGPGAALRSSLKPGGGGGGTGEGEPQGLPWEHGTRVLHPGHASSRDFQIRSSLVSPLPPLTTL